MEKLCFTVWKMSVMASSVIAVVLLARLVLRKAPKAFSYALWAVVLFRLLCPFAIESEFALFSAYPEYRPELEGTQTDLRAENANGLWKPAETQLPNDAKLTNSVLFQEQVIPSLPVEKTAPSWTQITSILWLSGLVLLQGYNALSLLRLRRRLVGSIPLEGEKNVRLVDRILSPFVMGVISPKIYLPSDLPENERDYILLHERTHIRRKDYISRALAWLALTVHWFNPLVWLAFYLAGKDMEMSCDEVVLRKMGRDIRADYATSLLRLSVGGKLPSGQLAFGSGDLEHRIENVLNYKKPTLWVPVLALVVVLTMGATLTTNQNKIIIDPSSVTSVASISSTTSGLDYSAVQRQRDVLHPSNVRIKSAEKGAELVRLINSYHKTVFAQGEIGLGGGEHHVCLISCSDGGFYLVDYWYWNGFNFNPFIHAGEDDFTTLVTQYDAEGNAGTTWQMEYYFDWAFLNW